MICLKRKWMFLLAVIIVFTFSIPLFAGNNIDPMLKALKETAQNKKFGIIEKSTSDGYCFAFLPLNIYKQLFPIDETLNGIEIPVFITTNGSVDLKQKYNIPVRSKVNNIHTATVTLDQLDLLEQDENVLRVDHSGYVKPLLDESVDYIKVDQVWNNFNLDGTGVIVGVVDDAIDYTHDDFKDVNGNSRILYLWDQMDNTGTPPFSYNYGSVYTNTDIDNGLQQRQLTLNRFHGTHVTGIAAGNGRASNNSVPQNRYKGVAPNADIIFVAYDYNAGQYGRWDKITDGMLYIADRAEELGKPFVINISLGMDRGPRNGTSALEQVVWGITNIFNGPGQGNIVCAAGNDAYTNYCSDKKFRFHAAKDGPGSVFLEIPSNPYSGSDAVYLEIFYPGNQSYSIKLTAPDGTVYGPYAPGTGIGDPGQYTYDDDPSTTDGAILIHNAHWNPTGTGTWEDPYPFTDDRQVEMYLFATFNDQNQLLALRNGDWKIEMIGGSGHWDAYMFVNNIANVAAFDLADIEEEHKINEPANAYNVITVGSFTTKNYQDNLVNNGTYSYPISCYPIGGESPFSSKGPSRPSPTYPNGEPKPDVLAPGCGIVSSMHFKADDGPTYYPSFETYKVLNGGEHYLTQGTSMAAPHIAGLVALMLQLRPDLTHDQIKECLLKSVDSQNRIKALDAVQCAADGIEDDQVVIIPKEFEVLDNYPNPFNSGTVISLSIPPVDQNHTAQHVKLEVFNLLGQKVKILKDEDMMPGNYSIEWDGTNQNNETVSSGMYFYRCSYHGESKVNKMVLLK